MKNIILISTLLLSVNIALAQSLDDALRYSKSGLNGTARYVSMGGAFGALGGDLSSIVDNPASTGVFMYSEINTSPTFYHSYNETEYLGSRSYDNKYNFNFNNIAFVGSMKSKNSNWKAINYAFSYKRIDNYHHNIYAEGVNNNNSITDFFADAAYGTTLDELDNNYSSQYIGDNAYQTYLISPDSLYSDNIGYHSLYNNYGQKQIQSIETTGRRDDWSFSIGANYKNKLYVGASLDYTSINYTFSSSFREQDNAGVIDNFTSMQYYEEYSTMGYGYAFKVGLIYRPTKWLRVAYSFHTPINYSLTDNYSHVIESWGITSETGENRNRSSASPIGLYDYNVLTPLKMMGALGFVINKKAIIGLEYEFVDYTMAKLDSRNSVNEFLNENAQIRETLKPSHNAKIGFEYRLGQISLRTGVTYYDSPYKSDQINKDAYTIYYSGGVGINIDYFYIDFAYSLGQSNYYYYPYQLDNKDTEPYYISQNTHKFITTMGMRF